MNRQQYDKLNSLRRSEKILRDNTAALSALPMVIAKATELRNLISRLVDLDGIIVEDISGYAIDKKNHRQTLCTTLLRLGSYAYAYYHSIGNAEMEAIVAPIKTGMLQKMPDAKLYLFAQKTHQSLLPDAALMPGSAPADIVLLATQTDAYYQAINAPQLIRQERKTATADIIATMRAAEALCQDIEIYMRTLTFTNNDLYLLWRASRSIDRTGVRGKKE